MDILGIGPMELLLILIVALMVFGPDRLPTIGSKLGRAMRDMRRATRAISDEISATRAAIEAPAKEIAEPLQEVADTAKSMGSLAAAVRNPGEAIRQSVLKELNAPAKAEQAPEPSIEPENTIAPPSPSQETALETDATLPSSDETPELPEVSLSAGADSTAAIDLSPDTTSASDAAEENLREAQPQGEEEKPQPEDAAPRVTEQ